MKKLFTLLLIIEYIQLEPSIQAQTLGISDSDLLHLLPQNVDLSSNVIDLLPRFVEKRKIYMQVSSSYEFHSHPEGPPAKSARTLDTWSKLAQ